jgi:hypothetical protein
MTEAQLDILVKGWELRLREEGTEYWFATQPSLLPESHQLAQKGWLDRRSSGELPEWRLSDRGLTSLSLSAVGPPEGPDLN